MRYDAKKQEPHGYKGSHVFGGGVPYTYIYICIYIYTYTKTNTYTYTYTYTYTNIYTSPVQGALAEAPVSVAPGKARASQGHQKQNSDVRSL